MSRVNILNVRVLDNPSPFLNPFQFEITFECLDDLPEDLEWKIIYVGSAESMQHDQLLDSVLVGPIPAGSHMFVFQASPPDIAKIPLADVVGVTVVLLTCSYLNQEFIRVGYYVSNTYDDLELQENPPNTPLFEKLQRNILANDVRVTKFRIDWNDTKSVENGSADDIKENGKSEVIANGENVPPLENTESTSNQLPVVNHVAAFKDCESNSVGGGMITDYQMKTETKTDVKTEVQEDVMET
ncbi:histone chaperone asf1b-B-like [Gigantopelta aegis]|uniref:histone chaperone asf1b-B-like n=1 Tax=Gigantopelta aegis TaxID=1735272 RepID=UPI001B88CCE3|nr:histone chaperone asf1b-B-like [Gigantopelta aegis]